MLHCFDSLIPVLSSCLKFLVGFLLRYRANRPFLASLLPRQNFSWYWFRRYHTQCGEALQVWGKRKNRDTVKLRNPLGWFLFLVCRKCCLMTKLSSACDAEPDCRLQFCGLFLRYLSDWPSWFHSADSSQQLLFTVISCGSSPDIITRHFQTQVARRNRYQAMNDLTAVPYYVKVKLSMCLTKHQAMKRYWASGGIAPRILDLGTRWRWVVSFTPRPLYP
jgi:hypothetical protein